VSYPFRYYGRSPADWHEGANEGHIYEVQFRTAPSESERAQLAKVYEGVLASGPARPSTRPWLWSQRFARFTVGERWSSAARATFAKVTDFLLAAHRVCPIAEVVFWGMREEGRSGWDRWTVAVQPTPDQGPAYDPPAGVRAVDPALPVGAPDAAFEAARLAARSEVQRTRIQKVNADSDVQLVPFEGEVVRPTLPVELEEAFGSPKPAWVDKNGRKSLADGYHPVFDTPRPIARHTTNGYTDGFAFLTEAFAVQRVVFPEGQRAGHYIAVHRDGDQGLTACRNHLYSVDFETGVATPRFIVEDELRGLAYLGDLWVVRGASALLVLDPSTEVPTVVATAKGKGDSVSVHRDDTVIITAEYGANPRVYAFAEGKLRKVAGFKSKLSSPVEVDGRVLFYASDARAYYALDGLDEAVEAWAAPLREKAEKARQKAAKKAKPKKAKTGKTEPGTTAPGTTEPGNTAPDVATAGPALVPCTLPEAPPSPPPTSDFGEHALAVGRFALLARTAPTGRHVERHDLAYVDDAGAVVTVGQAALEALGQTRPFFAALAVSADGRSAAATSPNAIVVLSADGELSRWENPSWSPRQVLHPEPGVVLLLDKEIMLGVRDANGWRSGKARKVSGAQVLRAHGRLLAVGTDAAQRLVLLGIGDGELIPLASFTERVAKPFFCDGRLYVSTPEGNGFEVVGVQSLLEEKLAAQARAKSKQKAKAKAKGEVSARPLEAVSIEVSALPELTWPPASAYGWAVENGYKGRVKTATFSRDGAVAWLCDGKALVEFNRTTHKSSVVCEDVAGKPIVQVAELDRDRLVCVTANKLATLRRKGDGFEVEQVVGTSKVTGLAAIPGRQAVATSTGREVTLFALPSGKKPKKVGTVTTRAFRLCGEGDRLYGMTYKVDEAWEVLGLDGPLPKT
jgi:hypothetical protein